MKKGKTKTFGILSSFLFSKRKDIWLGFGFLGFFPSTSCWYPTKLPVLCRSSKFYPHLLFFGEYM